MTNPVLEALIDARVADIVDPPRSWRKDMKAAFLQLPRPLQFYFANHDKKREAEIHRAMEERAAARKKLAIAESRLEDAEKRIEELEKLLGALREIEGNGDRQNSVACRADHPDPEGMRRDH